MGTFLVAVVAAFASGLVLVAVLGRYRESAWLPDWEDILSPAGQQRYEELQERFAHEVAASRFTFERARAAFDKGETEIASRLLRPGTSTWRRSPLIASGCCARSRDRRA